MFIHEMAVGSKVSVVVRSDKKKVVLESKVISIADKEDYKLAVQAFKHNNSLIRFDFGDIKVYVDNEEDGKSYMYPTVMIYPERDSNNESYHVISSNHDATFINRRSAVRVPISSTVRVRNNGGNILAKAKDLSCNGIAFYINKGDDINIGDSIICEFEEMYTKCKVNCSVVRLVQVNSDKILVGCKINGINRIVGEIVNNIQLQHRRNFKRK